MKLYYSPGACSLASHIALVEIGKPYDKVKVDLKAHRTEHGEDFYAINPKGYVPTIIDDERGMITENPAVLTRLAGLSGDSLAGQRLSDMLQWIGFIGTELHGGYHPLFGGDDEDHQAAAKSALAMRYRLAGDLMQGRDWLVDNAPSVADNYLFVTALWADKFGVDLPEPIIAFRDRNLARDAVKQAMAEEGLG